MKKLIAIGAMTLMLTTCGITSNAQEVSQDNTQIQTSSFLNMLLDMHKERTMLEQQAAEFQAAQLREKIINERIQSLSKHVDKTWYAFAGSTPEGWDCSGLVLWFYKKLGVDLEHSATKQMLSGENVTEPLPGDIVSFVHNGATGSYHNGIYIGEGLMIDSPRRGNKTRVRAVLDFADATQVRYTRINFDVVE